jgi:hypothetical protein
VVKVTKAEIALQQVMAHRVAVARARQALIMLVEILERQAVLVLPTQSLVHHFITQVAVAVVEITQQAVLVATAVVVLVLQIMLELRALQILAVAAVAVVMLEWVVMVVQALSFLSFQIAKQSQSVVA